MKKNPRMRSLAVAVGAVLATAGSGALASGFQLMEQSASGLGVAFAGMAAAGQDASTVFWNPAAMSLLPGVQGAAVLSYVAPTTDFKDSGRSTLGFLGDGGDDGAENAWLPALYATWMLTPEWSVGLALNVPFGLETKWDTPWAGQLFAVRSKIETFNINPTLSFKVSDMVTLGAGLSYQKINAELTSAVGVAMRGPQPIGKVEGDDWEAGWNIGALIDFQQGTRVGLTYRSSIDYTLDGDFSSPLGGLPVNADVELPDTFSIGLSHQFTPETRILADWSWTGWDSIQNLTIVDAQTGGSFFSTNTPLKFDNSWRAGLGVEHQLNPSWLLRAGVAYDKTPVQDEYRTPRLPDEDRTWLALGFRYQPEQNAPWWIDVGYTHIWLDDAESNLRSPVALLGKYEADIDIVAAQVSFKY